MKGLTAFACLSELDPDIIEESMTLFTPAKMPVIRGRRASSALGRFLSSGWGVALICTVVSLSVLGTIIWAGNRPVTPPSPPVTAETAETATESEPESVTEPQTAQETSPESDGITESTAEPDTTEEPETEPETEAVFHPDITEGGITFLSNGDGTCTIKGADKSYRGEITVPSTSPYGDTVTTVATGAFKSFTKLTSVTLPDTVTVIRTSAFQGCGSLVSVHLPPEVTEFGRAMFDGCGELQSVVLPKGLTKIDMMTFQTCVSLRSVVAQEGVTSIESNAFNGCRSLATLTLPAGLESVGSAAFMNCCGLNRIYYGGSRSEWQKIEIHEYENWYFESANVTFTS